MTTEKEQIEKMIAAMLNGIAFTWQGMSMTYFQESGSRIVDREMQKLRKKGFIDLSRKHRPPLWRATQLGIDHGKSLSKE